MSQVITFVDYRPPARYDGIAWEVARVQEAASASGPWTSIDDIPLSPVDSDPTDPQARSLTTSEASDTAGLWYRLIFVDYHFATSQPTEAIQNIEPTGHDYATLDQLKADRSMQGQNFADAAMSRAISTASRAVDLITNRRFWLDADADQVRFYTAHSRLAVEIDDLVELTELATDPKGDRSFDRVWTLDTDFHLTPLNAEADGRPWERIQPAFRGRWLLPTWCVGGVRVTGQFGWLSVPEGVVTATLIMAGRYVLRMRQAPFGIVTAGTDVGAVARIAASDPEVQSALADYHRADAWLA